MRVIGVNTVNQRGSNRRTRFGYVPGRTTKKAYVKLHPEDKIELF